MTAALPPEVREALVMTGCRDLADLIDMANVGRSMMDRMAQVTADGPLKGWSPADDPAEIVTDLRNALHDYGNAESKCKMAEAALEEAEARANRAESDRHNLVATQGEELARIGIARDSEREEAAQALSTLQQENERLRNDLIVAGGRLAWAANTHGDAGKKAGLLTKWSKEVTGWAALQAPQSQGGEA